MAKSADVRAQVRKHYVFDRLSLEQASKLADVAYTTAKRWRAAAAAEGDDWDKVRNASTLAGGNVEQLAQQILTEMLIQFNAVLELIKADADMPATTRVELLTSLMDNIHKSMAAMKKFLPEANSLAIGMTVIRGLAEFVQERFPQHGSILVEILEPFGDVLPKILADAK
jgi:transposase